MLRRKPRTPTLCAVSHTCGPSGSAVIPTKNISWRGDQEPDRGPQTTPLLSAIIRRIALRFLYMARTLARNLFTSPGSDTLLASPSEAVRALPAAWPASPIAWFVLLIMLTLPPRCPLNGYRPPSALAPAQRAGTERLCTMAHPCLLVTSTSAEGFGEMADLLCCAPGKPAPAGTMHISHQHRGRYHSCSVCAAMSGSPSRGALVNTTVR